MTTLQIVPQGEFAGMTDQELLDELRRRNNVMREYVQGSGHHREEELLAECSRLEAVIAEAKKRRARPH